VAGPRATAELTVSRSLAAGGSPGRKLDHKRGGGQKLILQDLLDTLKSKTLLSSRGGESGRRSGPLPTRTTASTSTPNRRARCRDLPMR
jgi:hypothetical protein